MKYKSTIFVVLSAIYLFASCKNPGENKTVIAVVPNSPMIVPEGFSVEGINKETTDLLLNNADHIDYLFNTIPLSMNQDGKKAIYQEMGYVSNQPMPGIPKECLPLARKIYLGNGEILLESDIYFSNGCLFQIYIKDEKALFGNLLSKGGIQFYKDLMLTAKQSMPENIRNSYTIPEGI